MMLDRDALERLEGFIATAKQPGELPWALIESDVANWLAANGGELLRVYRAWLDAPVMQVTDCNNPLRQLPNNPLDLTWEDFPTYNVRLVRDGDSGEGESC